MGRRPRSIWMGLAGIAVTLIVLLVLTGRDRIGRERFPLAGEVQLDLTLPAGANGRCVPLIATGRSESATLLFVRYTAPDQVVFGYDSWGAGGPSSAPQAFVPGRVARLAVRMPPALPPGESGAAGRVRVVFDGRVVLDELVHHHGYAAEEVHFGDNPAGGTVTNARFTGLIATPAGRRLNDEGHRLGTQLRIAFRWARHEPVLVASLLVSTLLGLLGVARLAWQAHRSRADWARPVTAGRMKPPHPAFAVGAAGCVLLFATVITGGTFRLFGEESFCRFYDDQAASLLQGRLDVPREALDGEAFLFEGKVYGYFGPTPALLRVPFVLAGMPPGRLSRAYMALYFFASLAAAYALLIQAARIAGGTGAWPSRLQVILLVLATGLGSTLFFASSRAYIYHEAILCGACFVLWSLVCTLRWLRAGGEGSAWCQALLCGVLAVHARPPAGLFALATLGCAAGFLLYRWLAAPGRRGAAAALRLTCIGLLAVAGVLSFNGLSYLKFRTFDGSPLRYNVQYGPERLGNIEGRNFHLANLPYGFAGYALVANASLQPTFPYFLIHGTEPAGFPGARIDLAEGTLAIPWAMPGLTLLAVTGLLLAVASWPGAAVPLLVLVVGLAPMAGAMLAAVAQSHRYTADFVPFLIAVAAFGLAGSDLFSPGLRRAWIAAGLCLAPVAFAITLAITVRYQGEVVWGVEPEIRARFLALRRWSDRALGFDR